MTKIFEGKTTTAIKSAIRETAFSDLVTAFTEIYGADSVSVVGNSEIAVGCGIVKDKDGFERECVFTVKPVVKDYEDRKTATKTIKAYDRLDEAEAYAVAKTEKEKAAEEKAKAKAEKKARDEKVRAEKVRAEKKAKEKEDTEGENPSDDCKISALYKSKVYTKIEPKLYNPFRCYVKGKGQEDGTEIITAEGLKTDKAAIEKVMQSLPDFVK